MKNLKEPVYRPFQSGEIYPGGWLLEQLKTQAAGLNGNLDKIWPDIRDSKWLGGKAEGWERVPYWLDGFIPLAWLLRDEEKMARAKVYIDAILKSQEEDGWICPCSKEERHGYDVWAVFLICKVLVVYYECSGDIRIEEAVHAALWNLNRHVETDTLFDWGMCRWYECLISIFWLYERNPQEWLLTLAGKLRMEGLDYQELYHRWPFTESVKKGEWSYLTHVVNIAMSLKAAALWGRIEDADGNSLAKQALMLLQRDHSMANGHFTGDECLAGDSPIQGSECCSVVEAMYSYEWLLALTGDSFWGSMLEKTAYNALPATLSPDMWTHQYDQQTNQVQCSYLPEEHVVFHTNSKESHLFGLEPNFGCCTANFGQGFPKFALSCFMKTQRGLAVTAIAPVKVKSMWKGVPYTCEIITEYPFKDTYKVVFKAEQPLTLELELRIPEYAEDAVVNGKRVSAGTACRMQIEAIDLFEAVVELQFIPRYVQRPRDMVCLWRGPLLYALPIAERWIPHEFTKDGVMRRIPYCDYEVLPESKWNYAFCKSDVEVDMQTVGNRPFSPQTAPIALFTNMCEINWQLEHGVCTLVPAERKPLSNPRVMRLIPYGCTNLRMTEMPLL